MSLPPLLDRISDYAAWFSHRTPDAAALVLEGQVTTYSQLNASVDALARALLAAGVHKGDRVATLQSPHPDYVTAWLAIASIGAIYVGLNPRYQSGELVYFIEDAQPKALLTRTAVGKRDFTEDIAVMRAASKGLEHIVAFASDPVQDGVISMAAFLEAGKAISDAALLAARETCGKRDPCVIVYTSGSTGKPKGALLHHEGIAAFALAQNEIWPASPHTNLNFLPVNHIGSLCDITAPCLVAGGTLHFLEQFDAALATRMIETESLTIWGSVPSVFAMQMATPEFQTTDMSSLQLIFFEGAAMPEDMIGDLLKIGAPIATNYGMTESVSGITATLPTHDKDILAHSVGEAFPGVDIKLLDADGKEVANGEPGEVTFKSRYSFLGYWRRPEAATQSFTPKGYFKSGDLAIKRPDGRYRVVGRLKEMYKSGGYNVYPREVELVLEDHPAVTQAAVVAIDDPLWQEVGVAFVSLSQDASLEELNSWCRQRLANYKVPKNIFVEPNMPLLPIGKIDKVALKRRADHIA